MSTPSGQDSVQGLTWEPTTSSGYTARVADTPFGKLLITWKSWKAQPSFTLDESPWGVKSLSASTADEAQREVEEMYAAALASSVSKPEAQEPAFYVSDSDVEALKDRRIAGRGAMLHKEAGEGRTAYFASPPAGAAEGAKERPEVSDEQIAKAVRPLYSTDEAAEMGLADDIRTVRAVLADQAMQRAHALASPAQQPVSAEARDAARWRRLVNASEMEFPVATIANDPENDRTMLYGRKRLEDFIDSLDEISDSYAALTPPQAPGGAA